MKISAQNYLKGLNVLWILINEVILRRAITLRNYLLQTKAKQVDLDNLLNRWYTQLATCYQIIERFRKEVKSQVNSNLPHEIYLWVYDVIRSVNPECGRSQINSVFQESIEFANKTFDDMIIKSMEPLLDVANRPLIPGTIDYIQPPIIDEKLTKGYVILYISGQEKLGT